MWDNRKFLIWLSKEASKMNIMAQLRSEDVEIWGKIETTKSLNGIIEEGSVIEA